MRFAFGCARRLYEERLHPRVFAGPEDLPALRARVREGEGAAIIAAMRRKARRFARPIAEGDALAAQLRAAVVFWPKPGYEYLWALPDMALVALLDEDAALLDAVRRIFLALPRLDARLGGEQNVNFYIPPLFLPQAYDLIAATLSEEEQRRFSSWAAEHYIARLLDAHRGKYFKNAAHNMTLGCMVMGLATLLAIDGDPGAPDLTAARTELLAWLEATLHTAIGPDGYPEEDIGYGTVVVPSLAQVVEPLRRAGWYDAYAECPRYARFGRAMLHFVQPWGEHLANTGDHGDQLRDREFILARQAAETRDPSLRWLLGALSYAHSRTFITEAMPDYEAEVPLRDGFQVPATALALFGLDDWGGEAPPPPPETPTAFRDRQRGIVTFRSGWEADAAFVVFDGAQRSPAAPGHYHDSCGHFSLSALGEYFAIDTGRYNVEQNQHNVMLIDGKSGRDTGGEWIGSYYHGLLTAYCPGDFVDFAAADSSHQHNGIRARRYLGLVKGAHPYLWTVDDVNKDNALAEFWWTLNTSPENAIAIDGETATITGWRHGHLLDLHFALPDPAGYPEPHALRLARDEQTSSSHRYVGDAREAARRFARPAEMLHGPVFIRPRLIARVTGYNGRFMAVMLPRRKDAPPATVARVPAVGGALAVRITFPEVEDLLVFAGEHHLLEAEGIRERGRWCVVRRRRASGEIVARALDGDAPCPRGV